MKTLFRTTPKTVNTVADSSGLSGEFQFPTQPFHDMVTPHFDISVSHKHGSFTTKSLADTGSATTIMSSSLAAKNNIQVSPSHQRFHTVTGDPLPINGKADISLSTPTCTISTSATVTPSSQEPLIIGFRDLQRLKIIPYPFPSQPINACINDKTTFSTIKKSLIKAFPDVLSDILPASAKTGPLMHIHLRPGEKRPFRITTARSIPLHWVEKAERCVNKLLSAKSIARQDTPTDWCAPAFFVMKPCGELRLVIDYTKLNAHIDRPIHVFPSASEIISGIHPHSRFFAKLDATSGYHQVPLDEESALLTTFLLPSGRFKHLVAPMGLSASSDGFCK